MQIKNRPYWKRIPTWLPILLLGVGTSGFLSAPPSKAPISLSAPSPVQTALAEGAAPELTEDDGFAVKVAPSGVETQGGSETLQYQVSVSANPHGDAAIRVGHFVVRHDGVAVSDASYAPITSVARGESWTTTISTPANLQDGHYLLRVLAASVGEHLETSEEDALAVDLAQYFLVADGSVSPISEDEFAAEKTKIFFAQATNLVPLGGQ